MSNKAEQTHMISPLGGNLYKAGYWEVREYELPFIPSEQFIVGLNKESSWWDVKLDIDYKNRILVAIADSEAAAWKAFEERLNHLVDGIMNAIATHEALMQTQWYSNWYHYTDEV